MRTEKDIQKWLNSNPLDTDELNEIKTWLNIDNLYPDNFKFKNCTGGKKLHDVIEYVYSENEDTDIEPLVLQFEKIEKEMLKMRKLINRL